MQIIIVNGPLSEREQDACIRQITRKYPASAIDKLYLEVHEDYVDVHYTLHRYRELRKMGHQRAGHLEQCQAGRTPGDAPQQL